MALLGAVVLGFVEGEKGGRRRRMQYLLREVEARPSLPGRVMAMMPSSCVSVV